jgi:hypothetical protein
MEDTAPPAVAYYRFAPDLHPGLYDSPHLGHLIPGRIYAIRADQTYLVANDAAWQEATREEYEAQATTIQEDRVRLQGSARKE